jgi:mucin-19
MSHDFRRRVTTKKQSAATPRRTRKLLLEELEDRTLLSVTSTLSGGILDLAFGADNDAATVAVVGPNIQVQSGGSTNIFAASSVSGINAHRSAGQNQSLALKGTYSLTGELDVANLASVSLGSVTVGASAVNVSGAGTISLQNASLTTSGDQTFAAAVTANGTSGVLSTSGTGSAQVTVTDSTLRGGNITLQATSTLTVSAQQSSQQGGSGQDFQNAQGTSTAQVTVAGASSIRATGNVLIQATTTDSTTATARAASSGTNSNFDAAIALANVNSTALARLGGQTSVTAAGNFQLLAANTTTLTASADGSAGGAAAKGGTFADAELTGSTTATITDSAAVSAASVVVSATSNNTVSSTAKSTQGGATQNSSATQQALQNNSSSTGGLGLAGAFALTDLNTRQTEASITSTGAVAATGTLQVTAASATTSSATADASSTTGTTDPSGNTFGVGVAVALDQGRVGNRAAISGNANVRGGTITVAAQLPSAARGGNAFSSQATSGAGAKNVGFAGAFALNAVNDTHEAVVPAGSAVTAAGNLNLTAQNTVTNTATAQPGQNVSAGKLGIGASFAYNVPTNVTRAEIETGARVLGATNLTLSATANDTTATTAKGGAGSQDSLGNAAVTPVVAVAEATNQTTARVGSSAAAPTQLSGALQVTATHTASTTTSAEGSTDATRAGFGISLGLTEAADTASATAAFVQAGGATSLRANSAAASSTSAKASVIGGETNPDKNADGKVNDQKNKADSLSGKTGANPTSAQTADGLVSLAGAISSNVATAAARAGVEDGGAVQAGGLLSVTASQNADGSSSGDGSQTGQTTGSAGSVQFGIGAGIALNTANVDTSASVGQNASVNAHGLTLQTSMLAAGGDSTNTFTATANSGAGATRLGVAGSLARNAVTDTSEAEIESGAGVIAGTGAAADDVTLSATSTTNNTASARSQAPGQAKFGVGPSVALALGTNTTQAGIDAGATLTNANDLTLSATGNHTFKSTADAGTQSTSTDSTQGTVGFTPAVAISGSSDKTTALIDAGPQISLSGNLTASTSHTSSADSEADAGAAGTTAAIGTAVGLNLLEDTSSVTLARDATTSVNARLTAGSATSALAQANASANGGSNEQAPTLTDRLKDFGQGALHPGTTSPSLGDRFNSGIDKAIGKAQAVGADGQGIGVAAALAGNSATDRTAAAVADGVRLTATGSVTVSTAANNDADAEAVGQAVGTSSRTSLAGAGAFNAVDVINTASVGNATVTGNGITVAADLPAGEHDDFKVRALGGAGSNRTTFAGSVGVNDVTDATSASAGPNAVLNSSGDLTVSARGDVRLENAASSATGSKNSGVGIAVAVNSVTDTTDASLGANSRVNAAGALTVSAQASLTPLNDNIPGDPMAVAVGGDVQGGNGLAGSLTVNDLNETTRAHVDNGAQVNTRVPVIPGSGNRSVEVHASDQTTLVDLAGALNLSKSLGVGIGLDFGGLTKDTEAFIARSATVQADRDINVHAEATESATSIAAAFSGSFSTGLAGAISIYEPSTTTVASIGKDPTAPPGGAPTGAGATTLSGGNTTVAASHTTGITTITGGLGGTTGNISVGAAFGRVTTADTVDAAVAPDAHVTARGSAGLSVTATNSEGVTPLALGGTGAGGTGFAAPQQPERDHRGPHRPRGRDRRDQHARRRRPQRRRQRHG